MKGLYNAVCFIPFLAAATQATPFKHARDTSCPNFHWKQCQIPNATVDVIECGTFQVPLDYTVNRPNETLTLDLQKVPATKEPKKGSILLNFGGPGADGTGDLALFAERMQA